MVTSPRFGGLLAVALLAAAASAAAAPIKDPIVRVREGGESIPIVSLPFSFDFGSFPSNPDPANCVVDTELVGNELLPRLSCGFQNRTGRTIGLIELDFNIPGDPDELIFEVEDPDELFVVRFIDPERAFFEGGGIPSWTCNNQDGLPSPICQGGEFVVELVGFPEGTGIQTELNEDRNVPEPVALLLLGTGMAAAGVRRRRTR